MRGWVNDEDQFLIVEDPGITNIGGLKIAHPDLPQNLELKASGSSVKISEPPKGLELIISGGTSSIKVGLNRKLPIAQIQGSFLAKYFSMVSNPPQNPATDRASFYGLGWGVGYTDRGLVRLSHSGAFNLGAATAVYLLPSEDLGIIVLTNGRPMGVPEAIAVSFLDLVQYGKMQRDYIELYRQGFAELDKPSYGTLIDYAKPPMQRSPALPASAYAGSYENDYFGKIAIAVRDNQLVLLQGSKQKAFPLQHYNGNVFTYQPEGENAYGLSAVTFTVDADGNGTNVTIENLNLLDRGMFKRVLPKR